MFSGLRKNCAELTFQTFGRISPNLLSKVIALLLTFTTYHPNLESQISQSEPFGRKGLTKSKLQRRFVFFGMRETRLSRMKSALERAFGRKIMWRGGMPRVFLTPLIFDQRNVLQRFFREHNFIKKKHSKISDSRRDLMPECQTARHFEYPVDDSKLKLVLTTQYYIKFKFKFAIFVTLGSRLFGKIR